MSSEEDQNCVHGYKSMKENGANVILNQKNLKLLNNVHCSNRNRT